MESATDSDKTFFIILYIVEPYAQ